MSEKSLRLFFMILRFLLGALLPVLIAALLITVVTFFTKSCHWNEIIPMYVFVSFFGYLVMGIQSIIYSLIMECYVTRKIKKSSRSYWISALLGGLASLTLAVADITVFFVMVAPGLIAGLCTGIIVRVLWNRERKLTAPMYYIEYFPQPQSEESV